MLKIQEYQREAMSMDSDTNYTESGKSLKDQFH